MNSLHTRLAFLFIVSSCWVACATPKSRTPGAGGGGAIITRKASAIAGPECAAGGPTVDVAITSSIPGKPPHWTWVADLRVRNRGTVPVWLLYDVGDGDTFQAILTSLVLSRIGPGRQGQVWSFSGDDSFEAVRIPGEADLLLRDAELNTNEQERPPVLVFAKRISVHGRAAEEWFGRPGLLPPTGDFSVNPEAPHPDIEREWKGESLNAPAVEVDVLCVSHVDLAAK